MYKTRYGASNSFRMARHSASTVRTLITAMIMATLSYAPPAVAQVNVWQRRIDDAAYYIASKQNNFALQNYFAAAVEAEKLKSKPHIYLSNLMLGNYYFQAKNYANAERYYYNAVSLYPREQGCLHDLEDTYTRLGKKSHATTVHQLISKLKSEDDSVDYGPFLTSLQQSVKQALGERIDDHPLGLKVSANPVFIIIVNANGELVAHCIEHSSGQRNVDQLTSACLDDASPFGSIPRHNSDTDTIINFNFMLNAVPNEQSVLGEKERSTKILSDAQKNFSAKNPLLVFYLREHAQNCVRSKSYDEALKYYQQALDFIAKIRRQQAVSPWSSTK